MSNISMLVALAAFVAGVLLASLLVWRFLAGRHSVALLQSSHLAEKAEQSRQALQQRLSEALQQLETVEGRREDLQIQWQSAREQVSALQADVRHAARWQEEIQAAQRQIETLQTQVSALAQEKADWLARADVMQREQAEKERLLVEARQQLTTQFENLANRLFEEKTSRFSAQSSAQLGELLSPLREQLGEFRRKVDDVYDKEARDRMALHREISLLRDLSVRVSTDAGNLALALKGDNRMQGAWGELVLERVLELSGLVKGREFEVQASFRDEAGNLLRPDVVVHLPEGRDVIIDSKVSLLQWEAYSSAAEAGVAAEALRGHLQSLRGHVKNLAGKAYATLPGVKSLDFVLLFVPVEAAFLKALHEDPGLFAEAWEKGVMLACPSTLLITLRTIQNLWRVEYQNRNAQKIADSAAGLHDQFALVVEALKELGERLDKTQGAYKNVMTRLSEGRGNVLRRVADLGSLGVKTRRKLVLEGEADEEASADDVS